MANEGGFLALIVLALLGGGAAGRFAPTAQPDSSVADGLPLTVSPTDVIGAPMIGPSAARTVPDPNTSSTATVSPSADVVGAGLLTFSDLPNTENGVVASFPVSGAGAILAGPDVVQVAVPGGGDYQYVSVGTDWLAVEDALRAKADAEFQQRTYPVGDPLWVHFEAVKLAADKFVAAPVPTAPGAALTLEDMVAAVERKGSPPWYDYAVGVFVPESDVVPFPPSNVLIMNVGGGYIPVPWPQALNWTVADFRATGWFTEAQLWHFAGNSTSWMAP